MILTNGKIEVRRKDGQSLSHGTGWFLRPDVVVTALHVVGKLQPHGWMHDVPGQEDATYSFERGKTKLALEPACFDAAADVALLRCEPPLSDAAKVLLETEGFRQGAECYADGYPGFDQGKEWTLKGQILKVRGDRLQLLVNQGTQVSWQGVSGSALHVGHRVAGLITAETSGTNTFWAAAASAIQRLLATYDAAREAVGLSGSPLAWNTDRERLLETIRGRPEAAELRERVAAIGTGRPQWSLSGDVLEDLQSYGVGPVKEGYSRLVRRELAETSTRLFDPWDEFEDLLFTGRYSADRFGGRTEQLKALDEFVEAGGGYFYVTGSAGLGKTALLAEWLRRFRARGERPAFHFITKRPAKFLDKSYTEPSCLRSLCMQLLDLNNLGGNLPPEMDRLRKLYFRLLTLPHPSDERVVVVLDGLDEALPDWTPGHAMFPTPLPDVVHVIFSARPVANKDWLRDLRLNVDPTCIRVLDRLDPDEVRDALRRSGIAQTAGDSFERLYDTVATVTQGDPDYVADVLELLKEGNTDLCDIKRLPKQHSDYLRQWWKSAFDDLHEFGTAFDDLMGTLAVLREPMAADDLVRVSDEDGLRKQNIDNLLERARRYVEGSARTGYHLVRTRIIELVNERLEDRMEVYRRRVADFCRRWDSPAVSASARRYAVRNAVAHLLEQDKYPFSVGLEFVDELNRGEVSEALREQFRRRDKALTPPIWVEVEQDGSKWTIFDATTSFYVRKEDGTLNMYQDGIKGAVALLDAKFIAAKWGVDGSYVSLLADLDALLDFAQAHPDNREAMCKAPAFAVMRESARDLMRSLPVPLYACWVRLKGRSQIPELLNALPTYRGEAREPLLAVANEIFEMFPAEEKVSPDRAWAGELLGRTIGLLPLVRTSLQKLETWSEVCRVLATHQMEPGQLERILEQAEAFVEQISERDANLKAACLAHLAKAVLPWDREASSRFLERAERITYDLQMGDRAMVYAIAFPAYRELNPDRGEQLASETAASLQDGTGTSLSGDPLIDLLAAWASEPATGPPVATARVLAERYLANPRGSFWFVPPALLLRFGLHELAWRVLEEKAIHQSDESIAYQLTDCLLAVPGQSDSIRPRILSFYTDRVATLGVARALMHAGYWTQGLAVVQRFRGEHLQEALPECLELALRQPAGTERDAAVGVLVNCLERTAGESWAKAGVGRVMLGGAARSALALARSGLPQARAVFGRVLGRSLALLPEGDADEIRYLVALGLSEASEYDRALAVVHDCEGLSRRVAGLVAVLKATRAGSEEQKRIAAEIKRQLAGADRDDFYLPEAVVLAAEAGEMLAAADPPEAAGVADAIENVGSSSLASLSAAAKVRVLLDPGSGPSRARQLVDHILSGRELPARKDIQAACAVVVRATLQDPDAARGLVDRLLDWASELEEGDRVEALAGLLGAVAEVDPGRSVKILNEAVKTLRPAEGSPEPISRGEAEAERLLRFAAELAGFTWLPWVSQLESLLDGFLGAVSKLPETLLVDVLAGVWTWLLAAPTGPDEFEAAAEAYLAAVARLPMDRSSIAEHLLESVPSALQARLTTDQFSRLCGTASIDFAENGHGKVARSLSQHIQDQEDRGRATSAIDACEFFYSLPDRSNVEEALFQKAEKKHKALVAMTIRMVREAKVGEVFSTLVYAFKQGNTRYLLLDNAMYLVFIALTRWGIEGATLVVDSLKEFDDNLVSAAGQIAKVQSHPPSIVAKNPSGS